MRTALTTTVATTCTDPIILNQWHPLLPLDEMATDHPGTAVLLGERLSYQLDANGAPAVWLTADVDATPLPVLVEYLYVWTCLGSPPDELFAIPEFSEPDRRNVHGGTIGVHVSAPRAIENFLDMGHFPYVHTDVLGVEPHTEVAEYDVHIDPETNDVWATDCIFYQPRASTTSTEGQMSDYLYRVPHPYCVILYKTTPLFEDRMDVIALFCRPVDDDQIQAHMFLSLLDPDNSDTVIRKFQQGIFGQDKPILENQYPKLLPLDPRAETPIRADKIAIAYRRWLSDLGVTYGVIPVSPTSVSMTS
jgi:phenylpropionate dioxygenase-like ring-hydroxylating dioxygenase large terminal subunit